MGTAENRRLGDAMTTDKETDIDTSSNPEKGNTHRNELNVGCRVEARFRGKDEWYPGVVKAVPSSASIQSTEVRLPTVDIHYNDGDAEENVPRMRVRLPGQKQSKLLNGDEVDVKRGKRIELARVVC